MDMKFALAAVCSAAQEIYIMRSKGDIKMLEQKKARQKIEDFINDLLDGETKENALDFVAWLRANKFGISTTSNGNSWKTTYKGKTVCRILDMKKGRWHVENYPDNVERQLELAKGLEELIIKENMQDVIWTYVTARKCCRCIPKKCAKQFGIDEETFTGCTKVYFGREFNNLCKYTSYFNNPDKRAVDCLKKICELQKQNIEVITAFN